MKRLLISSIFLFMIASGAAFAQGGGPTETFDVVGVYLDAEGQYDCATSVLPGIYHLYVVLTDLTSPGVHGFELKLLTGGALTYYNITFPTDQVINVGTREGEFIVGFGTPLMATEGTLVVMEFDAYLADEEPTQMFIEPTYFPSIEGSPCYLDSDDCNLVKPLVQSSGEEEEPVLFINDGHCGPVGSQAISWDGVKALYK